MTTTHAPALELFNLTKAYPAPNGPAVIVPVVVAANGAVSS